MMRSLLHFASVQRWRRKWQPTAVFLPGESQGRRSLVGCRLWGHTESDTTEATQQQQQCTEEQRQDGPFIPIHLFYEYCLTISTLCVGCYGRYQEEDEIIPASVKALTPAWWKQCMQVDSQNMSVGEINLRHIPIYKQFYRQSWSN